MVSKLFNRYISIFTEGLTLNNKELDIEFNVLFDDDLEPNVSEITIYNLSSTTRNRLKRGNSLTLTAGYAEDKGVILSGNIENVKTDKVGTDRATVIKIADNVPFNSEKTLQMSFKKGIKADQIIRQLAQRSGIKLAVLNLPQNKVFAKGHSVDGKVIDEIFKIAQDCGASAYIYKSQAYVRPLTQGDNNRFSLNVDTGLIDSPEYFVEEKNGKTVKGYKIKSLLQYRMGTASIVQLQATGIKATLRVRKGKHTCKGNSYYTEVEAIL
ncbi:hypothetical protein H9636_07065 [Ureibacillus sp. Re31]|uniref:Phage protein D n=1 Tax=Ureibacillus galli TaxID=2762222 RepID=A0ABR8XAS0_9BACL|nr:hypothetical protein [Ureibacillus galli]MBD8026417.1 hypothetical protein [Ureibacillus galli]